MEVALWLQSVTFVDLQVTFTDTPRISSMNLALWQQSVAFLD